MRSPPRRMKPRRPSAARMRGRVASFIEDHGMLEGVRTLLVAVSGGPDSMVLLRLLRELAPRRRIRLHVAHLHHGLRGRDADLDLKLVRDLCRVEGIPFTSGRADVRALAKRRRLSLEAAAREARYSFLRRTAARTGADAIALGHTADDQAETFLMRLLRGAGWPGLGGMRPVRDEGGIRIIRPLLGTWREEVLAYAKARGVAFRLDRSNESADFLRNRVRRRLIPYLRREHNPNVKEILRRSAEIIAEGHDYARDEAARLFRRAGRTCRSGVALSARRFLAAPGLVRAELLRLALSHLGAGAVPGYAETCAVSEICKGRAAHRVRRLPGGVTARREYGSLVLERGAAATRGDYEFPLRDGAEVRLPPFRLRFRVARGDRKGVCRPRGRGPGLAAVWSEGGNRFWPLVQQISADALGEGALVVRNRREGDRYQPLGTGGRRKLARIMIDEKLPLPLRRLVPVIAHGREIVWLTGHRIADRYKVRRGTRRVITLMVEKSGGVC